MDFSRLVFEGKKGLPGLLFSFPGAVVTVQGAFNQILGRHLEHFAQAEKGLKGMGPSGLQLLVMADGKIVLQNIFLDHAAAGSQLPVPLAQH
jgi:hypothetical protein